MRNQTRRGCSAARLRDPLPAPLLRGVVCVSAHQSISCLHRRRRVAPLAIFGIFFGSILPGFRRLRRAPRGDLPADRRERAVPRFYAARCVRGQVT